MSHDDTPRDRRITDDLGTVREWADETGAVPVRTERGQGVSREVALVDEASVGDDVERLDWPAFEDVLHDAGEAVKYDGSGTVTGLSVVDAASTGAGDDRAGATDRPEPGSGRDKDTYGEGEMRGVGGSAAASDDDRGDEAVRETRPDRDGSTTAGLDFQDVGKTVVDEEGTELGIVAQPSSEGGAVHVDVDPGVTERIMSKLGWTGEEDVDYVIPGERIRRVTDEKVVLASGDVETAGE